MRPTASHRALIADAASVVSAVKHLEPALPAETGPTAVLLAGLSLYLDQHPNHREHEIAALIADLLSPAAILAAGMALSREEES